jgi:hypothetical protein
MQDNLFPFLTMSKSCFGVIARSSEQHIRRSDLPLPAQIWRNRGVLQLNSPLQMLQKALQ